MPMYFDPKTKENVIDALMMLCLFYIIAHASTYKATSKLVPKGLNKDPVLVHAIVFAMVHLVIQKVTKKF